MLAEQNLAVISVKISHDNESPHLFSLFIVKWNYVMVQTLTFTELQTHGIKLKTKRGRKKLILTSEERAKRRLQVIRERSLFV